MTDSAKHFAAVAPKLRAVFAVFLTRAQGLAQDETQILSLHSTPLHRLIRTMHGLLRVIITVEAYVYRADLKARMLADPAWRRRVIAQLGGLIGLQHWQDRMRQSEARLSPAPSAPQSPNQDSQNQDKKTQPRNSDDKDACQFRLPPISRAAYARAERDIFAPTRAYNFKPLSALYDAPIPVTPCELRPIRRGHRGPPNEFYPHSPLVDIAWRDDPPERPPPREP